MPQRNQRTLRDGAVPKHVQLRDALAELCHSELQPDDLIASERELMQAYGVSRATVRRSIETLAAEGLLVRTHGKGTFVARPRVESHLHLASFTQDMRRRGHLPSTHVLRIGLELPPAPVATFFGASPERPHWRVERVRLADEVPMAHEVGWYSAELLADLDRHDLTGSMYEVFRSRYGAVVDTAEQTVWAEPADGVAGALQVRPTTAVLVFDRRSRTGGLPLESVVSRYRGDRYQIHMSLDSTMPSAATPAPHAPRKES